MAHQHGYVIVNEDVLRCATCAHELPNTFRHREQLDAQPVFERAEFAGWRIGFSPARVEWRAYKPQNIVRQRHALTRLWIRARANAEAR